MPSSAVVKLFDVADNVAACLRFRGIHGPVNTFVRRHREKQFRLAIVPTHARSTHRGTHPRTLHQRPKICWNPSLTRTDDRGLNLVLLVSVALIAIYGYAVLIGLSLDSDHAADSAGGLTLGAGEPIDFTGAVNAIAEIAAIPLARVLARYSAARASRQEEPAQNMKSQTVVELN